MPNFVQEISVFLHVGTMTVLLLFAFISLIYLYKKSRGFMGSHIFLPRLLASVITGWMSIFGGMGIFQGENFLNDISKNELFMFSTITIMLIGMFIFGYSVIGKENKSMSTTSKIGYSLCLILLAYVYSYITGCVILLYKVKITGNSLWDKAMNILFSVYSTSTYWAFLFLVVVAMFIGVFLQLLFQEKRATEPL
jgi:ABC-type dipeptide/oligopeptide/nickel transport system permease component